MMVVLFEVVPLPFRTETVNGVDADVPVKLVLPLNCVAVFVVSAELAMVHGEQLGPLKSTVAVAGSKPVPVMVNVKD